MRLIDIIASLFGLLILSPLFLVIALAVKLTSPGPVFHRGLRVGRFGVPFRIFKFRSMVANAEKQGPGITTAGDARVTKVGRFLRRTKLDELPQLINVLKGEMSLVGPRPEDPRYVEHYTPEQRRVLDVRPGITSYATLHYRNEETLLHGDNWEKTYIERLMPHKLCIELAYLRRRSVISDIAIIFRTVLRIPVANSEPVGSNVPPDFGGEEAVS